MRGCEYLKKLILRFCNCSFKNQGAVKQGTLPPAKPADPLCKSLLLTWTSGT